MSDLCRDYTCSCCEAQAHGIPFGPVGAEWCAGCWFNPAHHAPAKKPEAEAVKELVDAAHVGDAYITTKTFTEALSDIERERYSLMRRISGLEDELEALEKLRSKLKDAAEDYEEAAPVRKAA